MFEPSLGGAKVREGAEQLPLTGPLTPPGLGRAYSRASHLAWGWERQTTAGLNQGKEEKTSQESTARVFREKPKHGSVHSYDLSSGKLRQEDT